MSKTSKLAEALLRDRDRRKSQPQRSSVSRAAPDFDPFFITRWCVVAGGDPGYLVSTPMHRGPVGWFIACDHCGAEFESVGWKCCPTCMELPAEKRRANRKPVQRGSSAAPTGHRAGERGSRAAFPQKSGAEIIEEFPPVFGSADFPTNVIGGHRFPVAQRFDPGLRRRMVECEVDHRDARARRRP
jgi:hypothetical protein